MDSGFRLRRPRNDDRRREGKSEAKWRPTFGSFRLETGKVFNREGRKWRPAFDSRRRTGASGDTAEAVTIAFPAYSRESGEGVKARSSAAG